ncbi:MAG: hypothetical protein RML35_06995 [Chloroherpetonaceae bacterium]|nr:hypothetical protein [Chloroherpetonaceae bacterium]
MQPLTFILHNREHHIIFEKVVGVKLNCSSERLEGVCTTAFRHKCLKAFYIVGVISV